MHTLKCLETRIHGNEDEVSNQALSGLRMAGSQNLRVADATESRQRVLEALENRPGIARDIVALNAGAAIYAAGMADSIGRGIEAAQAVMQSGAARVKLDEFVAATHRVKSSG